MSQDPEGLLALQKNLLGHGGSWDPLPGAHSNCQGLGSQDWGATGWIYEQQHWHRSPSCYCCCSSRSGRKGVVVAEVLWKTTEDEQWDLALRSSCERVRQRDAKTYQRANNDGVEKILCCFVGKVSNGAISRFLVAFLGTFWNFLLLFCIFFYTIWVFLTFCTVLSRIRFVVIYALFRVKSFWLKPCLCKKNCLFACLVSHFSWLWQLFNRGSWPNQGIYCHVLPCVLNWLKKVMIYMVMVLSAITAVVGIMLYNSNTSPLQALQWPIC